MMDSRSTLIVPQDLRGWPCWAAPYAEGGGGRQGAPRLSRSSRRSGYVAQSTAPCATAERGRVWSRSPQVAARCSALPHLPPRTHQTTSLCCVASVALAKEGASSPRHVGLVCGSCSSAHGFRLAFLPTVGRPPAVGLSWCFSHCFTVLGSYTGDLNPVWTGPCWAHTSRRRSNVRQIRK